MVGAGQPAHYSPGEPPLRSPPPGCQRPVAEVDALVYAEVGIRAHHLLLDAIGGYLQECLRGLQPDASTRARRRWTPLTPFPCPERRRHFSVLRPTDPMSVTPREQPLSRGQATGAMAMRSRTTDQEIAAPTTGFKKYSRHRPTAARTRTSSKAVVHGHAILIDIRCRRYVRSAISRIDAADPHLPLGIFLATGRCTLVAAVRWIRREKQKSARAVIGGRLPAIHAKSPLTGGIQRARRRGIDPLRSVAAGCRVLGMRREAVDRLQPPLFTRGASAAGGCKVFRQPPTRIPH